LEKQGIATTGISLVRANTESMRPPRFLWVPFELGRPFGAPGDAAFQTKVLRTALALLERADGPVLLEDFPEDAPASPEDDGSGWVCPVNLPKPAATAEPAMLDDVLHEIAQLAPWYSYAHEERGRTTFGVTGMAIEPVARFLHAFFEGLPKNPVPGVSLGEALRLACEDIRSWYLEAATARPGAAAGSRALADWFWGETAAGRLLLALQPVCAKSPDAGVRHVGASQFVPRSQRHRQINLQSGGLT
jgi:hypothetical protein